MLMEDIKHDGACVVKLLEKRLDAHNSGTFKGPYLRISFIW